MGKFLNFFEYRRNYANITFILEVHDCHDETKR